MSSAYYYCVAAYDTAGNQGAPSDQIRVVITGVSNGNNLPKEFALYQNYPNPFNPGTIVSYDVPSYSYVTIKLYDLMGQTVATLVDAPKTPGHYEVYWSAQNLASGVCLSRMEASGHSIVRKIMLLK
jgi:hypothetical protein